MSELTALAILPDRALADQFLSTLSQSRAFQVVSDLKSYPALNTLEIRLRQIRPEVVLLDVNSDREKASEILRFLNGFSPMVQAVGLSPSADRDMLRTSLRLGASEFLHAPFDLTSQWEAVSRLLRLREPECPSNQATGTVVVFSSVKPGSGATTLATQIARSIRRSTGQKVLLADFDLLGGSLGFYSRIASARSFVDALQNADKLNPAIWSSLVTDFEGVDILPGPDEPYPGRVDPARLSAVLEYARAHYDWVFIDLPAIFQSLSLLLLSNADRALLVSTSQLPSLHLARKAVLLLEHLGFPKDRFQIIVNRLSREELPPTEFEKLLNCSICSKLPNDFFSLNRFVTLGEPLDPSTELGRGLEAIGGQLASFAANSRSREKSVPSLKN